MNDALAIGLASAAVTAFVVGVPAVLTARAPRPEFHDAAGTIQMSFGALMFYRTLAMGLVAVHLAVFFVIPWPGGLIAVPGTVLFCYLLGWDLLSGQGAQAVLWDDHGIEGPSRSFPLPFLPYRRRIAWEDMRSLRYIDHGQVILKRDGRGQILWSRFHVGHDFLRDLIARNAPQVTFK